MKTGSVSVMKQSSRSRLGRALTMGLAAGLVFLLAGDRGQTAQVFGIDPLLVLRLQIKNNVLFIFDTSGSMKWPVDIDAMPVGADDPMSRMYQAKQAVAAVVAANSQRLNFGIASYNVLAASKTLNQGQDFDEDVEDPTDNTQVRDDGPFIYVSNDIDAATYYNTYTCPAVGGNRDGFFCNMSNTFTSYDGQTTGSNEVYRSFGNRQRGTGATSAKFFADPYPVGCTPGVNCRYYMHSRLFRSGVSFTWNTASTNDTTRLTSTGTISCPNPPAGLTGNNPDANGDGVADQARPCFEFIDQSGNSAIFYYSSAIYENQAGAACDGAAVLTQVAPCTGDNSTAVLNQMRPELPVLNVNTLGVASLTPTLTANTVTDYMDGDNTPVAGLRADQSTPLAGSLDDIRTANPAAFPSFITGQKNFVILLTDGDDTCASTNGNTAARIAAQAAQSLYYGPDDNHRAETFIVAFASAVNLGRANLIAKGGHGCTIANDGTYSACPVNPPRDAFSASNTEDLIAALQAALDLTQSSGQFAASSAIVGTVFELATADIDDNPVTPDAASANVPDKRYSQRYNLLFQPTFDLPNWEGHLYAFRNDGTFQALTDPINATGRWDAGETLFENVAQVMEASTGPGQAQPNRFRFADLHGGATVDSIGAVPFGPVAPIAPPVLRRRIFTSAGNGAFARTADNQFDSAAGTGRNVIALWPPNQANLAYAGDATWGNIDPAVGTVGPLDDALGLTSLQYPDLFSLLGACDGSTEPGSGAIPADCNAIANPTLALNTALKEGRQILLAYLAGAKLTSSNDDGKPLRDVTTGELLFRDRGWLMLDSTLSTPAVVSPPLRRFPDAHTREWLLFRDGRRDANQEGINELDLGFGLRDPDAANQNPASDLTLKPRMSVIYLGANDGLHAISAESSIELWTFLPYDLLSRPLELLRNGGQVREPHTYSIASSIRAADIFVPGAFNLDGIDYAGRWRTVLFFGRGPGGKYYTALDVTAPGPYTRPELETNPPWVMWNRGNPGPAGAPGDPYLTMGETWSVPAIGNVDTAVNTTPEWLAWMGSGYSENPAEGAFFYTVDAVTGDILSSHDLRGGATTYFGPNAIVAGPSAFNSKQLDPPEATVPGRDIVTSVYVPDIKGRIWKFNTVSGGLFADQGATQPFTAPLGLIKLSDVGNGPQPQPTEKAFVFASAGGDERVPGGPPAVNTTNYGFLFYGFRDDEGDVLPPSFPADGTGALAFDEPLTSTYRGLSQPLTAFNQQGQGRVLFTAVRYNPPINACLSTFDTILFGLGARTGATVYANGPSTTMTGVLTGQPQLTRDQLVITTFGAPNARPALPRPVPTATPIPEEQAQVIMTVVGEGSAVCRN